MKKAIVEEMQQRDRAMSALEAGKTYDLVTGAIATVVNRDKSTRIAGLGTFTRKYRAERKGRNPSTGEPITISGRDVIHFKAAQ